MKILMLHQHFSTPQRGGAIRSYYLARALVEQGHQVALITMACDRKERSQLEEGIEVHYLPIAYDNRFSFYARGWAFMRFMIGVMSVARNFRDFDRCYAISVPLTVGLIARWIKFRYKIPYFFEVGDLWPEAPIQLGFVKNYFLKLGLYDLEKLVYRHADSIVALSPAIQSAVAKKAPHKEVHLVTNMADCDFFVPEKKTPALEDRFQVRGKLVVSYIGALGVANGLEYFVECANASRKARLPIHFLLCGDGGALDSLKAIVERLQLQNLSILPFVNRDGVKDILNVTDACFVCYKNVPILETGSPNKFFDGLAAGKLIIVNFGGWIKEEIERHSCGFFVDPRHPTDFVRKIERFVTDDKARLQFQQAARELGEKKYSRKVLSEKFVRLF